MRAMCTCAPFEAKLMRSQAGYLGVGIEGGRPGLVGGTEPPPSTGLQDLSMVPFMTPDISLDYGFPFSALWNQVKVGTPTPSLVVCLKPFVQPC